MSIKKIISCTLLFLLASVLSYASPLSFTNESREPLENKTQQQISSYQKLKLARETAKNLASFIKTTIKLTEEEKDSPDIENIVAALAQIQTEEKEVFSEDNEGFVEMKLQLEVDSDNVKYYIDKINSVNAENKKVKKDKKSKDKKAKDTVVVNKYKKEFEELANDKRELETSLKKATKIEYENELEFYTKNKFIEYEYKGKEYNSIAYDDLNKIPTKTQEQKQVEATALQSEIQKEKENIESKLSSETDSIEKAKLENKALISKLNSEARTIMLSWNPTEGMSKEQLLAETKKIKQETSELLYKLSNMLSINKNNLAKAYDDKIQIVKTTNFPQPKPVKDQWETTESYNKRLHEYENNQHAFIDKANKTLKILQAKKEEDIFKDDVENLQALVSVSKPFIKKLNKFQQGTKYYKGTDEGNAKLVSLGEVNADEQYFVMNIEYSSKNYVLKFDFKDIGIERAKGIYQEQNQFVIEPLFSVVDADVVGELVIRLTGFSVKHNTKYVTKVIDIENALTPFKEVVEYENYEKKLASVSQKRELLIKLNSTLKKTLKNFEENKNLQQFTTIIKELKRVNDITDFEKIEKLNDYKEFVENTKIFDDIIVSVSVSGYHIVGLKNNGKVVAMGDNQFGQCNVQEWEYIKSISAGELHTLGLQRAGKVFFAGDSSGKSSIVGWDMIVDIGAGDNSSAGVTRDGTVMFSGDTAQQALVTNLRNVVSISLSGKSHIVALKKDGTVENIGDNTFGQSNVNTWKDIKKIVSGTSHIVGLKNDGTVVAVGKNKESQCNVSEWKDIVDIAAGSDFTVGLKKDGTIVCSEQMGKYNFSKWTNIASISSGSNYVVGIKRDGSLVAAGDNQSLQCDISKWSINFKPMK